MSEAEAFRPSVNTGSCSSRKKVSCSPAATLRAASPCSASASSYPILPSHSARTVPFAISRSAFMSLSLPLHVVIARLSAQRPERDSRRDQSGKRSCAEQAEPERDRSCEKPRCPILAREPARREGRRRRESPEGESEEACTAWELPRPTPRRTRRRQRGS